MIQLHVILHGYPNRHQCPINKEDKNLQTCAPGAPGNHGEMPPMGGTPW